MSTSLVRCALSIKSQATKMQAKLGYQMPHCLSTYLSGYYLSLIWHSAKCQVCPGQVGKKDYDLNQRDLAGVKKHDCSSALHDGFHKCGYLQMDCL